MIKKYYEITIRDYNIMERTGSISQLKKNWNIFPSILFIRWIKKELTKLAKELNLEDEEIEKENTVWEIESQNKINILTACYFGILNLLELGTKVKSFRSNMVKNKWRKLKISDNNLSEYIAKIKEYSGIEIKELADLNKILKEIRFRKDKFNENFNKKKIGEKVYLMSVALGVFSYLNQTIDVDMTVMEFSAMREDAMKQLEKERAKENGD